jgi:phosphatidylglycerol:prolipoprotein diacylglycerol transferase
MYPILFHVGGLTFTTHGFLAVLGIITGSSLLYILAKKKKIDTRYLINDVVYSVSMGVIGARVVYFLLYRDQFATWQEIFFLWNGGMVSYGGFILGGITFVLLFRRQKSKVYLWLDALSISFAFGLFFGRLGNIFAGEYSGINSKYGIGGIVPVTLYEGVYVLIIGCLLLMTYLKNNKIKEGLIFWLFVFFYGFGRFIIDFWRDEQDLFYGISLGQIISLSFVVLSIYFLINRYSRETGNLIFTRNRL